MTTTGEAQIARPVVHIQPYETGKAYERPEEAGGSGYATRTLNGTRDLW
jgi:hypothetical protein